MSNNYQQAIGQMQLQTNSINPALYQLLIQQQNQVNLQGNLENLLKQTNQHETGQTFNSQIQKMDIQNSNERFCMPSQILFSNQNNQMQDRSLSMNLLEQQQISQKQQLINQQQYFQAQNILHRDMQQNMMNNQIMQPTLTGQNIPKQILLPQVGDQNKVNTVSYLQPASVCQGTQEINNLNLKLQGLNLQNDSYLISQQNQQNIIQQHQPTFIFQQHQQQIQYPQNQQIQQSQNLLNVGSSNLIGSQTSIGSYNELQYTKNFLVASQASVSDLQAKEQNAKLKMILDQQQQLSLLNQQINQQNQLNQTKQQLIQPIQQQILPQQQQNISYNSIQLQNNQQNNIHLNYNPLQQIQPNLFLNSDQIQQIQANPNLQKNFKNDKEVNQQIIFANQNETSNIYLKGEQNNSRGEINASFYSLPKQNNSLQHIILQNNQNQKLQGNINLEQQIGSIPFKHQMIDEAKQFSDREIQLNNYLPQTLPSLTYISNLSQNQIFSNSSMLSLKQQSSFTQSEKYDESQQSNFQKPQFINTIPSLNDFDNKQIHKNKAIKQQIQQRSLENVNDKLLQISISAQQNNKINKNIHSSENIQSDLNKEQGNIHFQLSSEKDENESNQNSQLDNTSKNRHSNYKSVTISSSHIKIHEQMLKQLISIIQYSCSHSPLKNQNRMSSSSLIIKKENKMIDEQNEKDRIEEAQSHSNLISNDDGIDEILKDVVFQLQINSSQKIKKAHFCEMIQSEANQTQGNNTFQSSEKDENVSSEDFEFENSSKSRNSTHKVDSTTKSSNFIKIQKEDLKKLITYISQSSSSSPLKTKKRLQLSSSTKKQNKNNDKQNEKDQKQEIPSHDDLIPNDIEPDLNKQKSSKRNNNDPYQNYEYWSQIGNQLRKQILKCFYKNVEKYIADKNIEIEIAEKFKNLQKETLDTISKICSYWSQFDNPTKREQLINAEYKKLCDNLGFNHEITPLGQKGLKDVFCKSNQVNQVLKFLYYKFNDDTIKYSKKQRKVLMRILYIYISQNILDEIQK